MVGVNGVGKTTSLGKLAQLLSGQGHRVVLAAADTFRAAAADQLAIWAERSGSQIIRHHERSDPAAVVFDAINAAKSPGADTILVDTAGRLHNKGHLMEELRKIGPQALRELGRKPDLVIVNTNWMFFGGLDKPFDGLAWFNRDPRFREEWTHYRPAGKIGIFELYRRS